MIKTLKTMSRQDKERYTIPRKVQDVIPIRRIWKDGIFLSGNRFSRTYRFTDINYLVASREDKESMFLTYSELKQPGPRRVHETDHQQPPHEPGQFRAVHPYAHAR